MKATIKWKTREEGGRLTPPLGEGAPPYATMVRFMEPNDSWPPENAWSLVVEKKTELDLHHWVANVRFLVENAPKDRLHPGQQFELYEGNKCVASGVIN